MACWNMPNEIIDTDKVENLKELVKDQEMRLEIENLAEECWGWGHIFF